MRRQTTAEGPLKKDPTRETGHGVNQPRGETAEDQKSERCNESGAAGSATEAAEAAEDAEAGSSGDR